MNRWLLRLTPLLAVAVAAAALLGGRPAYAVPQLEGLQMTVTKSPWCGCCDGYIEVLNQRGAKVTVIDTEDVASAKLALGIPPSTWSCHTTEVDGYVVEGHVPLEAIEQLLAERPAVTGIALPGMPAGSPGMNGVKTAPFQVVGFDADGVSQFGSF